MADFSITLTVEDAKVNEFVAALRWNYGPKSTDELGVVTEYSVPELKDLLRDSVQQSMKDIFKRYKRHILAQSPVDDVIGVT